MHRAVRCAAALVSPNGLLVIALYRRTSLCWAWRWFKRWYSGTNERRQRAAMRAHLALRSAYWRIVGVDIQAHIDAYAQNRGMDYYNDVHDWLGGYPYESIRPAHCRQLVAELGFSLVREFVKPIGRYDFGQFGSGCDEFVFRRNV